MGYLEELDRDPGVYKHSNLAQLLISLDTGVLIPGNWTRKIRTLNPIRIENIGQRDDSYQRVNVRPANNGQNFQLCCTHAFKR